MRWLDIALKVTFVVGLLAVVTLSLLPAKEAPSPFNDKLEHLAAYAALGLVGSLAFPTRRAALRLALLLPLLAVAMEIAQHFAPGRSPGVADAVVGGAGAWLALLPRLLLRTALPWLGER